jgi:hypothetical protein
MRPVAAIFDIDGTLAKMGDRYPYDWKKVGIDTPHEDIIRLSHILDANDYWGYHILVVTGRDEACRPETTKWLKENDVIYTSLFMRPKGNNEKDVIIKARIYKEEIEPLYEVHYVFDDRNQTVQGWRDLGLRCLQVAPGDF